jgi:GNAT superfamily N-acetyltransferase
VLGGGKPRNRLLCGHEDFAMIRYFVPADTPRLLAIAEGTGVFKPMEIHALKEVLDDYRESTHDEDHHCVCYESHGKVIGFAYWAPAAMTDRTWYLYWIAVSKESHARGVGGALLHHVEEDIRKTRRGRLLLIETSSLPHYELTRRFYLKHSYEQPATLPDFYADGDDLVVFRKRLN